MEIIGYIAAALTGLSLSLIGAGGTILTVPLMVYLFALNPSLATCHSLFVVGSASAVGACYSYRQGLVRFKTALLLALHPLLLFFLQDLNLVEQGIDAGNFQSVLNKFMSSDHPFYSLIDSR